MCDPAGRHAAPGNPGVTILTGYAVNGSTATAASPYTLDLSSDYLYLFPGTFDVILTSSSMAGWVSDADIGAVRAC